MEHRCPDPEIQRFPGYLEDLEREAYKLIADRHKLRIELGRVFNSIKNHVGHGQWSAYFEKTFASGMSLRTAQNYMKRAIRHDSKNESFSFSSACDPQSKAMARATSQAAREVERAKLRSRPVYRLVLHLENEEQRTAIDAVIRSSGGGAIEKEILALLMRRHTEIQGRAA